MNYHVSLVLAVQLSMWSFQVLELEVSRSKVEVERDELLKIRAALEAECETRLNELQSLASAVETEKGRSARAEEELTLQLARLTSAADLFSDVYIC